MFFGMKKRQHAVDAIKAAQEELLRGVQGMLGRTLRVESQLPNEDAIVLGTVASLSKVFPVNATAGLKEDGYQLQTISLNGHSHLAVIGANDAPGLGANLL